MSKQKAAGEKGPATLPMRCYGLGPYYSAGWLLPKPTMSMNDSPDVVTEELSECPTCGRDDFASDTGVRQHHSLAHGESISKVTLECEICGDEYEKRRSEAEESRVCSNECKTELPRDFDDLTTTVSCGNCGEELERLPYQMEKRDNHFCDHSCHGEWLEGENHHNWNGGDVTVECCVCGDTKEVPPSQAESEDRHFCYEKGCRYDWISENHSGEDNPHWKGGVRENYLGNWTKQRRKARERDGNECRACGMTNEEHKQKHGKSLHVHHIKPARTFDDPKDAHELENLVTTCAGCHARFEGLPVFPDRNK